MGAGFSPDDKLIGSVSWNKTFRIWSHANGNLLHTFKSNHQNWTGGFSPDSCFFAGSSGEDRFWVWNVVDGSEIATHAVETLNWSPDGKQEASDLDGSYCTISKAALWRRNGS